LNAEKGEKEKYYSMLDDLFTGNPCDNLVKLVANCLEKFSVERDLTHTRGYTHLNETGFKAIVVSCIKLAAIFSGYDLSIKLEAECKRNNGKGYIDVLLTDSANRKVVIELKYITAGYVREHDEVSYFDYSKDDTITNWLSIWMEGQAKQYA
jgi:hypothetical protein